MPMPNYPASPGAYRPPDQTAEFVCCKYRLLSSALSADTSTSPASQPSQIVPAQNPHGVAQSLKLVYAYSGRDARQVTLPQRTQARY